MESIVLNNRYNYLTTVYGEQVSTRMKEMRELYDREGFNAQNLSNTFPEAWEHMFNRTAEKEYKKLLDRRDRFEQRTANRALYLPSIVLSIAATKKEGRGYWRYDLDMLESAGLMARILEYHGVNTTMSAFQLMNRLPKDERGFDTQVNEEEWEFFRRQGYMISKERVAWQWKGMAKEWLTRALPRATDFSGYNHRMRSPLLPGGFLPNLSVGFHNQKVNGELQGVDGSGLYDPTHPDMQDLVERYGACVFQLTLITKQGRLAKGIIVPREGLSNSMPGNHGIWLDHLQVKGAFKSKHKQLRAENALIGVDGCFIGIMKTWNRRGTMPAGFEQIECIKETPRTKKLLDDLVVSDMEELRRGGVDRLLAAVAKDDKVLKCQIDLVAAARAVGEDISALELPTVMKAVGKKLQRLLWVSGQGAGVKGSQLVLVIDNTLKSGEIVAHGVRPGQAAAIWRFPTVLACGLVTAKGVEPQPHHKVNGEVIKHCVFMNGHDVLCMQGDDDGDIVGLSTHPSVVELWENRLDDRFYAIEPDGEKLDMGTDSRAGHLYCQHDPMGPVGQCTIYRSRLLSVGDRQGALAMSVMIQEAIDSAKRKVRYTDWKRAANPDNWTKKDGKYYLHVDDSNYLEEQPESFPLEEVRDWHELRLNMHGCVRNRKLKQDPIGWRTQYTMEGGKNKQIKRKIDPNYWLDSQSKQKGYSGGNLVHFVHDRALECWLDIRNEFLGIDKAYDDLAEELVQEVFNDGTGMTLESDLLERLLTAYGHHNCDVLCEDWNDYLDLRDRSGLSKYGAEMKKILSKQYNSEGQSQKSREIELATSALHYQLQKLSMDEIYTIWVMEMTPWVKCARHKQQPTYRPGTPSAPNEWRANNPMNAIRAISHPKSPVMVMLGIEPEENCGFLDKRSRGNDTLADGVINHCLSSDNPSARLTEIIFGDTSHAKVIKDAEGNNIPLHQCEHCRDQLQNKLVMGLRESKRAEEAEALKGFVTKMGKYHREARYRKPEMPEEMDEYIDDEWDNIDPYLGMELL